MKYSNWLKEKNFTATNKTVLITGANSGIGYFATLYFASLGAKVIMACRNNNRALLAKNEILTKVPNASINIEILDISSVDSIKSFIEKIKEKYHGIDILVNNAGVYMPKEDKTVDGLNSTIGTNFVGTYFLTEGLKTLLKSHGRIVIVTSLTDKFAHFNSKDPLCDCSKSKGKDYAKSKFYLSCYTTNLQQDNYILQNNISVALVDPGITSTNLLSSEKTSLSKTFANAGKNFLKIFTHSPEKASLVIVSGGTDENLKPFTRIKPRGLFGISGYPKATRISKRFLKKSSLIFPKLENSIKEKHISSS